VLIFGAATWVDRSPEFEIRKPRTRMQTLPLHLASILGPLFVALIGMSISAGRPVLAATLVLISFGCSSIRFLITQDRQDVAITELQRSRDLLHAGVEGTADAIFARDRDGRYILANRAARNILGSGDPIGKTDTDFFAEESADRIRATDLEVLQTGRPLSFE